MYKQLQKFLDHTRQDLWAACEELNLDLDQVDQEQLAKHIQQCSHCDIWTKRAILDLDQNPICVVCRDVAGL